MVLFVKSWASLEGLCVRRVDLFGDAKIGNVLLVHHFCIIVLLILSLDLRECQAIAISNLIISTYFCFHLLHYFF